MIYKGPQPLGRSMEARERMSKSEVTVSNPWKTFLIWDSELQEDNLKFLT